MNVLDEAKKRPVVSGITLASVIGFLVLWPKVMPGLELIVRIQKAPDVAEAALSTATETREWIDAYIEQQKQQQELERQRYELERQFNEKVLEMQQQQQYPNVRQGLREYDKDGSCWYCDTTADECDRYGLWERC